MAVVKIAIRQPATAATPPATATDPAAPKTKALVYSPTAFPRSALAKRSATIFSPGM